MITKVWYKKNALQKGIGFITDTFSNFVEIKDIETNEYIIVHCKDIEIIEKLSLSKAKNYIEL